MKRFGILLPAIVLFLFIGALGVSADPEYIPGRIIVSVKLDAAGYDFQANGQGVTFGVADLDQRAARWHITGGYNILRGQPQLLFPGTIDWSRTQVLLFDESQDPRDVATDFQQSPNIRWAVTSGLTPVMDVSVNDPEFRGQWWLRKIYAPAAWEFTMGNEDVLYTAFDTGVDFTHVDLRGSVWVNPGEDINHNGVVRDSADYNGVDDDGNGIIDDLIGYDFVDVRARDVYHDDPGPMDPEPADSEGHGSHVAGITVAQTNNGIGMASVAGTCKLVCTRTGYQYWSTDMGAAWGTNSREAIAAASNYSINNGVKVVNMSFGSYSNDSLERECMINMNAADIVLVAAAGNDGVNRTTYPCSYPDVVGVAATDQSDRKAEFSNFGSYVDVCAPGVSILSLMNDDHTYVAYDGTSMSSPVTAGVVCLIRSLFPDSSAGWTIERLVESCDPIDSLNPDYAGNLGDGRVNAYAALAMPFRPYLTLREYRLSDSLGNHDGVWEAGERATIVARINNTYGWQDAANVRVTLRTDTPGVITLDSVATIASIRAGYTADNGSHPFIVSLSADFVTQYFPITFHVEVPGGYTVDLVQWLRGGHPRALLVDRDSLEDWESTYFGPTLDRLSTPYFTVSESTALTVAMLQDIHIVIWESGTRMLNTITPAEQAILATFLEGGGKLFLSGQNLVQNMVGTDFLRDYCATGIGDSTLGQIWANIYGPPGDTIFAGIRIRVTGAGGANDQRYKDALLPIGTAVPLMLYERDSTTVAMVGNRGPNWGVITAGFGMEGITDTPPGYNKRAEYLERVFQWLGMPYQWNGISTINTAAGTPQPRLRISPNPAKGPVAVDLVGFPRELTTEVSIRDLDGRTLTRFEVKPAAYPIRLVWNGRDASGKDVPAGIYLATAWAGNRPVTARITLIR